MLHQTSHLQVCWKKRAGGRKPAVDSDEPQPGSAWNQRVANTGVWHASVTQSEAANFRARVRPQPKSTDPNCSRPSGFCPLLLCPHKLTGTSRTRAGFWTCVVFVFVIDKLFFAQINSASFAFLEFLANILNGESIKLHVDNTSTTPIKLWILLQYWTRGWSLSFLVMMMF